MINIEAFPNVTGVECAGLIAIHVFLWCRVHPECLAETVNQELKEARYVMSQHPMGGGLRLTHETILLYRKQY